MWLGVSLISIWIIILVSAAVAGFKMFLTYETNYVPLESSDSKSNNQHDRIKYKILYNEDKYTYKVQRTNSLGKWYVERPIYNTIEAAKNYIIEDSKAQIIAINKKKALEEERAKAKQKHIIEKKKDEQLFNGISIADLIIYEADEYV